MEIRALRPDDARDDFSCGDETLDRFLRVYAGQNQFRHHLGETYVAVDAGRVVGFATVASGQLEGEVIPASLRRRLPAYPIPVLRLARMAVDLAVTGQGLGSELLRFILTLALEMSARVGCAGVVVDAKPHAVAFYQRFGFIRLDVVEGASDARPAPHPLFLSVRAIRAARGKNR